MRKLIQFLLVVPTLLLGQSEGTITAVDTLQFEIQSCNESKIIRLAESDYFMVMFEGATNYPYLKTFTVDADGNIGDAVTDTELLRSNTFNSIDAVRLGETDNYAILWSDITTGNAEIVTMPIGSADGTFGVHIDSVTVFDSTAVLHAKIGHIENDLYWCMYWVSNYPRAAVVEINTDGTIDSVCHEIQVWTAHTLLYGFRYEDFAIRMGGGTYLYVASGAGTDAYAYTFQDSSVTGYLKQTGWGSLAYDVGSFYYASVELVNDTSRYVIGSSGYGGLNVIAMEVDTTDGSIDATIDEIRLYNTDTFDENAICKQEGSDTIFVAVGSEGTRVGEVFMETFGFNSANGAEAIFSRIDSVRVHNSLTKGDYPYIMHARDDVYLVSVAGSNEGLVYSFKIPPATAAAGWAGKVNTVFNPGKVNTVLKANIAKINTVQQ